MASDRTAQNDCPETRERILIVEDNRINLALLQETLYDLGHELLTAEDGETALEKARKHLPAMMILDVVMPGLDGFQVCRRLKDDPATSEIAVIFLSVQDDVTDKIHGLKLGAVDFITKPFQMDEVIARVNAHLTIHRLKRKLKHELKVAQELLKDASKRLDGPLLGESDAVQRLRGAIATHAATSEVVLLTGSPGSGEEATARAIHHKSDRCNRVFIYVDCSLPCNGRSLLFGPSPHESGKIELADGGTLYLEAVSGLPLDDQQRLFDFLVEMEERRAQGGPFSPDVRIIAFASRHLASEVRESRFHFRLYRRLSKWQIKIPALVERLEDVPMLVQHFVRQYARCLGKTGDRVSEESMQRLSAYCWPGNIRELQNLLERAVVLSEGSVLEVDDDLLGEGIPLGRYRLVERLGGGGMGEVWLAKHQFLLRPVAVKLIRPEVGNKEENIRRFQKEAQATARLHSPNAVRLYDFGVSESGTFFYVMELLKGMDLELMVSAFGPMQPERVVMLLRQACRALIEAHGIGLVHRDIKPGNLFVCELGPELDFLKVLDFGMVCGRVQPAKTALSVDKPVQGTPAYIAPELLREGNVVDERVDLYALGCVAYWMLTGRLVFDGDSVMDILMHQTSTVPVPPSSVIDSYIPASLEQIVMQCLEKNQAERPGSALELWEQLGKVELSDPWTQKRAEEWWRSEMRTVVQTQGGNHRITSFYQVTALHPQVKGYSSTLRIDGSKFSFDSAGTSRTGEIPHGVYTIELVASVIGAWSGPLPDLLHLWLVTGPGKTTEGCENRVWGTCPSSGAGA